MGKSSRFWLMKGQKELIDAVILAAAGGHNMLMIGEPGVGSNDCTEDSDYSSGNDRSGMPGSY
ncbi:ATP-binding protein, partial [[Ruminococcus] lactaris]|uniref:ATP-binding protein n=1 Tax=[Ruminococcus] lactaris TaxID=46228 RepID=UPI0039A1BBFE